MIWLNKVKYKISIIFLILVLIFNFYSIEVYLGYLYFKNGNYFNYGNYQIHLPLFHWAYLGQSDIAYVIVGRRVNSQNLSVEFIKNPKCIDIKNILNNCDKLKKIPYQSSNVSGVFYICSNGIEKTMYFQNNEKDIFIRGEPFVSNNQNILIEYELLLSSILSRGRDMVTTTTILRPSSR